jgi:uncharacterized membrane protein YgcG
VSDLELFEVFVCSDGISIEIDDRQNSVPMARPGRGTQGRFDTGPRLQIGTPPGVIDTMTIIDLLWAIEADSEPPAFWRYRCSLSASFIVGCCYRRYPTIKRRASRLRSFMILLHCSKPERLVVIQASIQLVQEKEDCAMSHPKQPTSSAIDDCDNDEPKVLDNDALKEIDGGGDAGGGGGTSGGGGSSGGYVKPRTAQPS